jgi:hypothetical protein
MRLPRGRVHERWDGFLLSIWDDLSANVSAALQDSHHDQLIFCRLAHSGYAASLHALVHVPRFAADESFVRFNFATEFRAKVLVLHGQPNPMQHEPCRLLINSHVLGNLATADAVLAVKDHPHGGEPLVQRDRGVLHDGPDLDGELAFGMVFWTLPSTPLGVKTDLLGPATGTNDLAVRPSPYRQVINAVIRIREVKNCLLEALWFVAHNVLHEPNIAKFNGRVKSIITLRS